MLICVLLMVAAAASAGCTGTKNATTTVTPEEPTLFVDYQRSGGIAGINDRLVIFDNGVGLISSRTMSREILINKSELEQLSLLFGAAQFPALEGNYTSRRGGADLFQYSITYQGKTVNTEETAVPDSLEPVLAKLNSILDAGIVSRQNDLPAVGIPPG